MSESLVTNTYDDLLHVKLIGEPGGEEYNSFLTQVAEHAKRYGKFCILLEVAGAASRLNDPCIIEKWEYVAFHFPYWESVTRLALVGDCRWALMVATLCTGFTPAEIRHFPSAERMEAKRWMARFQEDLDNS
jgi:hypothetical protein